MPNDHFEGTTFDGKAYKGFKDSDHYEKWGNKAHTAEGAKDYAHRVKMD